MDVPFSTLGKTQTYSFGKSARFAQYPNPQGREFLNLIDPFKTRTCSFGYGERSVLLNHNSLRTPSPGAYSLTPEPGISLSFVSKPNPETGFKRNSQFPGPGSYSPGVKNSAFHTFSLSRRELYKKKEKVPGPGAYEQVFKILDKPIGGFVAKAKKSVPIKEKREKSMPGPGSYKIQSCFGENKLVYPVIKYKKR